ncbi:Leucyl aminopeptidase (aminopeptidase T) [Planifilum fulgidum]|jgi:aminopeptidase|uniref:Leucyl aminopeptidase (Aminopeptidase T) n=1 Tax=Planifilum fulgidum TaxID=201973 RepID=A0A1I2MSC9_9BACL|nr:aminopeptidase [Planifilum fulgidum]SFF93599.1 Leucyl aminopeptidase (aminopeptidase T) [Planifilum fulgidum]
MRDPRIAKLAHLLVNYSCRVKKGDKVLIEVFDAGHELARALVSEVYAAGGYPHVELRDQTLSRALLLGTSEEHMNQMARFDLVRMKEMDCYIGIRGSNNINETADVPADKMQLQMELYNKPVHKEQRVKHTRWVVLRYPNASMAQLAQMSQEAFEDFYFDVCTLDYAKMDRAMDPLVELMERTDQVRIVGPGTDLTFSIKGMPAIKCSGQYNIPDGEVFTAPVRDSVNGVITFNTASVYQGFTFENIRFEFRDGKIVSATANDTERLNKILDTDEGARYIGEFSLGFNPYILHPMKDTLFDEKIDGSFHFTPGSAYEECNNGNSSAIHWDLVSIQRPEYGGGEIWFDGKLIRKDGRFVVPELEPLNPENLKG